MDFVGPIVEILKCTCPPICKCIEYHRKLEEYKENLENKLAELKRQKGGIEQRLEAEHGFDKLPKEEVKIWLENVQKIIDDAEKVEQTFKKKCFSRARLAKLVEKKIQEVNEWYEKGTSLSSNSLVIDAPLAVGTTFQTTGLPGETTAKKNMEEIWRQLMANEIKKIGVWGIGGVGKTTIMKQINDRLIEEKKFHHVIWVTVSEMRDDIQVQDEIVNALKQNFSGANDRTRRAGMLLSMLKEKRFVLILDDVWKTIQLEELGIPEPNAENGCKLVITTRSSDVCRSMGCNKTIQVNCLPKNEALELFLEKAELNISQVPTLKETVELVAEQCAGLPLAIVIIASSLKGEEDIREWNTALHELSNNVSCIKVDDDKIFVRLKFSYDQLKDERIRRCFLYCALYPEDHNIRKKELVDCWIAEGLVDEMDNLQATEDRAHSIIENLVRNCLLLEGTDRDYGLDVYVPSVKLHDVVRDMALKYITSESHYITSKGPLFMVKAGMKLEELPSGKEWKENLDKVSLMDNLIIEIPSSLSPNCQFLSTLLLQGNPFLESIPESFFSHMHGLKILNLSRTRIESLPNSISELKHLTALFLQKCRRLRRVPSLARLRALEKLELGFTAINEVPTGMEMLANLTSLDLFCSKLHIISAGIFSKLRRLQKLWVNWGLQNRAAMEEVARLKNLDRLSAQFRNLQDFNNYAKSLNSKRGPDEYLFLLGLDLFYESDQLDLSNWRYSGYDVNKMVILHGCNICGREEDSIVLPKAVEFLRIDECDDVRNMSNIPTFNTLERLEILVVEWLFNLSGILLNVSSESSPVGQYSHLKVVRIVHCHKVKKLISSKLMSELKNLEQIYVNGCDEMEELIAVDDDDDDNEERSPKEFLLPKLESLILHGVEKLKSICSCNGSVMVCDSLQQIYIQYCPQLKRLPIYVGVDEKGEPSPPPALDRIQVSREWWEALEWDYLHPRAKTLLLPFCEFAVL